MKTLGLVSRLSVFGFGLTLIACLINPLVAVAHQSCPGHHNHNLHLNTVDLNTGVTLQYAERGHGKGNVVVFLHGYTDSWFSFSSVIENLPGRFHAYAITQRGHGDSDKPEVASEYEIDRFVNDFIAFLDHFRIRRVSLVGHSMGSIIAQRIAMDHPDRIKKLVLIGATADPSTNPELIGLKQYVDTLEDPIDPDFIYNFQASTVYNPLEEEFLNRVVMESQKVPAFVWKAALTGLVNADYVAELPSITAPTLIVWGDKDGLFLMDDQITLEAGISDSTLLVYENAGHGLHWEDPIRFAYDLAAFLFR
ncbi:MAG: alpha/beta hydrolase [Desulfobacterium sp.]|nr:alpha/beta hydrolase [Desulfobacterium sp.]